MTATPLAQLIDSVKTTNGWSDPDLVRNADKRGHTLTKSNISRYRNENPLISIKGSVIEALAAGLRVSVSHVAVAAVQSMGISLPSYDMPTVEQAIRLDASLSDRDRQVMMATLSGIRSVTETSHDTDTKPASDADRPPASGTPRETREGEKTSFGRVGQALSGVQDKPDGLNEQQSSLEAGEVVHMVPPPAGTAPYTLAASAHWPDGVDVDASGTADEYQAWLDDGSPDTWRVYRERRNAGLRPAALDYGPDDEGESERAAREQDEAAEGSQDGEE
ncbi:hypothetical protein [Gordonia sp. SND2]|uniref:hypothetical protein n=1 Tax=Gordonia sp. SND2 TaxID=3388659 RepID=UPI00398A8BD8